jgi:hypothetical protein
MNKGLVCTPGGVAKFSLTTRRSPQHTTRHPESPYFSYCGGWKNRVIVFFFLLKTHFQPKTHRKHLINLVKSIYNIQKRKKSL